VVAPLRAARQPTRRTAVQGHAPTPVHMRVGAEQQTDALLDVAMDSDALVAPPTNPRTLRRGWLMRNVLFGGMQVGAAPPPLPPRPLPGDAGRRAVADLEDPEDGDAQQGGADVEGDAEGHGDGGGPPLRHQSPLCRVICATFHNWVLLIVIAVTMSTDRNGWDAQCATWDRPHALGEWLRFLVISTIYDIFPPWASLCSHPVTMRRMELRRQQLACPMLLARLAWLVVGTSMLMQGTCMAEDPQPHSYRLAQMLLVGVWGCLGFVLTVSCCLVPCVLVYFSMQPEGLLEQLARFHAQQVSEVSIERDRASEQGQGGSPEPRPHGSALSCPDPCTCLR
jgi:hypothetical protein